MLDVESKIRSIIAGIIGVDESKITPEANFKNDLGLNSLDMVEIIVELENEFKMPIPDQGVENIKTVGEAIDYVEKKLSE
ncbi:MAG: acyl carrier protein [Flavobacteriales bacterium]|nr:acyl carrier protein [Flavobacteriales bacterium]